MSDVIDLSERRNAAEMPDREFVHKDEFGRTMFEFLLGYEMDGSWWSIHLTAYDQEDAQRRVAAMRESLRYDGQIYTIIPA